MPHKIIHRFLDAMPCRKFGELLREQVEIERVRVVPVDALPCLVREVREVAVVAIHVQRDGRQRRHRRANVSRECRLPGTGAARNANYQRLHRSLDLNPEHLAVSKKVAGLSRRCTKESLGSRGRARAQMRTRLPLEAGALTSGSCAPY